MHAYTLHAGPGRPPTLVREGFSWGAFVFAPLWLLANRAWIGAAAYGAGATAALLLAPPGWNALALLGLHLLAGFEGQDLLRDRLARQGQGIRAVTFGTDEDMALLRALSADETLRGEAVRAAQGGRR
jgi:hypothetical protein